MVINLTPENFTEVSELWYSTAFIPNAKDILMTVAI